MNPEDLFVARPDGANVLLEYRDALDKVVVRPSIMGTSRLKVALNALNQPIRGLDKSDINATLLKALSTSFDSGLRTARGHITVAEMDYSGNLFNDIVNVYNISSWERPYLVTALYVLEQAKDVRLRTLLGLLGRGNRECDARKRMAFSTVISTAADVLSSGKKSVKAENESATDIIQTKCIDYIEDLKERAFRSTFLEPALMYFDTIGNATASGDVDVHGSNPYLAVLQATTGIIIPRIPLLQDAIQCGVTDFMMTGMDREVAVIREPANVGKSYRAVIKTRLPQAPRRRAQMNSFIFNLRNHCSTPLELGLVAADEHRSSVEERRYYADNYLSSFVNYFSAENLLPLLFNACMQDEAAGTAQALQTVFEKLKTEQASTSVACVIPEDCDDVRYWLWDFTEATPVFNLENAQRLFAKCGVTKPLASEMTESVASIVATDNGKAGAEVETATETIQNNTSGPLVYHPPFRSLPKKAGERIDTHSIQLTAAGDAYGGGTGREHLHNLHNDGTESWNKWFHPGYVQQSWVDAVFADGEKTVSAYAICSANDCPDRDPVSWQLLGFGMNTQSWISLHEVHENDLTAARFEARWQWLTFRIPEPRKVSMVKLNITKVRGVGNGVQLGHFHLFSIAADSESIMQMKDVSEEVKTAEVTSSSLKRRGKNKGFLRYFNQNTWK